MFITVRFNGQNKPFSFEEGAPWYYLSWGYAKCATV